MSERIDRKISELMRQASPHYCTPEDLKRSLEKYGLDSETLEPIDAAKRDIIKAAAAFGNAEVLIRLKRPASRARTSGNKGNS